MNKRGETIISCEYDHVEQFQDGLAVVKKDGKFGVIDKNTVLFQVIFFHIFLTEPKISYIFY